MSADKILLHIDVLNAFSLDFPLYCKDRVMHILSCYQFCLCLNFTVQFQTSRDWNLPCLFYICIEPASCTKIVKWTEWIYDFVLLREDRDLDSAFWKVPTLSAKTSDFFFLHKFFFSVELFLFRYPTDFRESLAANRCSFIACLFNSFALSSSHRFFLPCNPMIFGEFETWFLMCHVLCIFGLWNWLLNECPIVKKLACIY